MAVEKIVSGGAMFVTGCTDKRAEVEKIMRDKSLGNNGELLPSAPNFEFSARNVPPGGDKVLLTTEGKARNLVVFNCKVREGSIHPDAVGTFLDIKSIPTYTAEEFLEMSKKGGINYKKLKFNLFGKILKLIEKIK